MKEHDNSNFFNKFSFQQLIDQQQSSSFLCQRGKKNWRIKIEKWWKQK